MNLPILIGTIVVEVAIILGVSLWLKLRSKKKEGSEDFITSGRNLPMIAIAATQALTCLGGGHILGMPGGSWDFGVAVYWYCLASAIMLIILLCFTGPWIRRFGYTTINGLFEKMFDRKTAVIMAGIAAGTTFGIMTLELQGVGTIIASLTQWPIAVGCVIGGVIAFLYVIFGGMKEVGWVNVFNAVFMYIGVFVAIFYIGGQLPNGWAGVNEFYRAEGDWMLNIMANENTWLVYIIGTILANLFYVPIGPQAAQVSASAKNVSALRKSVLIAAPLNCIFGALMIAFGMAAKTIPEFAATAAAGGPPLATMNMIVGLLPPWMVVWLFAAFCAAMLSTIAVQVLALSTIFINDIFVPYFKKGITDKQKMRYLRISVLLFAVVGTAVSLALPPVQNAIVWLFAWLLPAFWVFVFGMFWKRSAKAGFFTLIIAGIFNCVWSFTPLPGMLGLDGNNNSIAMLVVSFLMVIIITALDKKAKPGYIKMYKKDPKSTMSPEYLAELAAKKGGAA